MLSSRTLISQELASRGLTLAVVTYINRVNFLGANLTNEQLASAKSLRGSTLPDGTVVAAVPEPSSLFSLGAMVVLGVGSAWKRRIH